MVQGHHIKVAVKDGKMLELAIIQRSKMLELATLSMVRCRNLPSRHYTCVEDGPRTPHQGCGERWQDVVTCHPEHGKMLELATLSMARCWNLPSRHDTV